MELVLNENSELFVVVFRVFFHIINMLLWIFLIDILVVLSQKSVRNLKVLKKYFLKTIFNIGFITLKVFEN